MLLALPDVRQAQSWSCAEAAVRCVLGFHKIALAPRFSTPHDGADPRQVEAEFRRLGLRVTSGEMTTDDLRHFAAAGKPPVCLVHWFGDPCSHYVVVRGVSRGVWFHDVDTGPGRVSESAFTEAWRADDGRMPHPFRSWGIVAWPAG